jgi:dTDP-4-amino-4,6-dideoxygalactose transaminase
MPVDFNRPIPVGKELDYIAQAVRSGHISGDGPFTRKCSALLEQDLGVPKVLLTTSCTHALDMSAILHFCLNGKCLCPARRQAGLY